MVLENYLQKIDNCTRCGFCRVWGWAGMESVCPVYPFTPGWEVNFARGRVKLSKCLAEGAMQPNAQMAESVYACTLCGRCEVACPVDMPLHDIFQALRMDLSEKGLTLQEHKAMADSIEKLGEPFGERRRRSYADRTRDEGKVNILYFPGCNANYNAPKIVRANKAVLSKAGFDFHVMDEDACCGYPLYENGQMAEMKKAAERAMSIIREYSPELILTACPGCFHSLKNLYPQRLGVEQPYQVADISQFLIREVKPRVALGSYCRVVAWHDPCVLGRQLGIYEEPRDILRAIPGLKLVELESHHEKSKCCGASLAEVEKTNDLSLQVAVDRLKEAREVGAEELVTSCPACYITLKRAETFSQSETRVRYITELLDEVAAK